MKKVLSLVCVLSIIFSLAVPAFATESIFSNGSDNAFSSTEDLFGNAGEDEPP